MSTTFNVRKADGYEQLMGRWSKRLSPLFITFVGLGDGDRIVDVGCGTGSLTLALLEAANVDEIAAIDVSPVFVEATMAATTDPRIHVHLADATDMPFETARFDKAMSLLVLHFVPEFARAIREMRRVVRPGGTVAAAVWDQFGGLPAFRMLWDTASGIDPLADEYRARYNRHPLLLPGAMRNAFTAEGLVAVDETQLVIRMDYASFADYWAPFSAGEGPLGNYLSHTDAERRPAIEQAVHASYLCGRPDGPRSFAAIAWACKGIVP